MLTPSFRPGETVTLEPDGPGGQQPANSVPAYCAEWGRLRNYIAPGIPQPGDGYRTPSCWTIDLTVSLAELIFHRQPARTLPEQCARSTHRYTPDRSARSAKKRSSKNLFLASGQKVLYAAIYERRTLTGCVGDAGHGNEPLQAALQGRGMGVESMRHGAFVARVFNLSSAPRDEFLKFGLGTQADSS